MWVRLQQAASDNHMAYDIIDGSRRFFALNELAGEGQWPEDNQIGITIFEVSDEEALELSLLSVETRRDLTLIDQVSTFYRLKLSGMAEAQIADHFGVTEQLVRQRIAIGGLAPVIIEALKAEKIDLSCAKAFTKVKSREGQEQLYADLTKSDNRIWANTVNQALGATALRGGDMSCKFIGQADYEAAGGTITSDLFSTEVLFDDVKLVQKLFDEKITGTAQNLKAEGWAFVDILKEAAANKLHTYTPLPPKGVLELSETAEQALRQAEADLAEVKAKITAQQEDEDSEEYDYNLDDREQELQEIIQGLTAKPYTEKQIKKSGCVIAIGNGQYSEVEIRRGLLKPSLGKKPAAKDDDDDEPELEAEHQPAQVIDAVDFTESLNQLLAETARNATKLAMVQHKQVLAYRMGLAARLLDAVDRGHEAPFQGNHRCTENGVKFEELMNEAFKFQAEPTFPELLTALELLEPDQIIQLEAYLAADQLSYSNLKSENVRCVIDLIDPDMKAEGFAPDVDFLTKVSRKQLDLILAEINPKAEPFKGKKPELLAHAAAQIAEHNWLPQALRTPSYQGPGSATWQEALAERLVNEAEAARDQTPTEEAA